MISLTTRPTPKPSKGDEVPRERADRIPGHCAVSGTGFDCLPIANQHSYACVDSLPFHLHCDMLAGELFMALTSKMVKGC